MNLEIWCLAAYLAGRRDELVRVESKLREAHLARESASAADRSLAAVDWAVDASPGKHLCRRSERLRAPVR